MTSQISAPIRIVALIGVIAALAMGGWMFTQGQGGGAGGTAPATPTPQEAIAQANAVAGKLNAHNLSTAAGKRDAVVPTAATAKPKAAVAAKPAVVPVTKPKVSVKPAAPVTTATKKPAVKHVGKLPNGTPNTIASQLATHGVVVVLLYNPRAKVDSYSLSEAALGASQAGAGFLSVDVLDQRQAAPFTTAYGVLQDPTILFFVHPGKLVQKLIGFADHETVSQAASNEAAKLGWVPSQTKRTAGAVATTTGNDLASWRTKANAVCKSNQVAGRKPLPASASDAQGTAYVRGVETQINHTVASLSAVTLPSAASKRALAGSFVESLKTLHRDYGSFLQARLKHDGATAKARFGVLTQDDAKAKALTHQLGLTECA